jgi:predicted nuclease of restriction endonuclease-like (RecB) superfamily
VGNYLRPAVAIRERWTKRQFQASLFERIVLSPPKVSPAVRQIHPEALNIFRDAYNVEFLGLPSAHAEADLHRGLSDKLEDFLIELGRDFCFVASEYPLQVGGRDFALDLLFFHRGLNCLVDWRVGASSILVSYAVASDARNPHETPRIRPGPP